LASDVSQSLKFARDNAFHNQQKDATFSEPCEFSMPITVESRVHRTLRKIDRFKPVSRWDSLHQLAGVRSPLSHEEKLLGAYENVPGQIDRLILVTNEGFHLLESAKWRTIKFSDMTGTEWPLGPKNEANTLIIKKKTDTESLPILGGSELGRDLFVFMRFLDRVITDRQ